MNSKKFYFISGMPRSGSTILANLLAQNPKFHATHTSGCLDVLFGIRNQWPKLVEHQAHPDQKALKRVLKSVLYAYYDDVEKPIIFDKSRGWVAHLELLEEILGEPPKILIPVRPLPDILSSFEKLHRETSKVKSPPGEAENYIQFQTVEGRCAFWMQPNSPVGLALNRINDVVKRGHKDKLHFIGFQNFTNDPQSTVKEIYDFLGEQYYDHNFDHVEQVTVENDEIHGYTNLHKIEPRIQPKLSDAEKILGKELVAKYSQTPR